MSRSLSLFILVLSITILSSALVFWRAEQMALPDAVAQKGLSSVRIEVVRGYIIGSVIFGLVIISTYSIMIMRWPNDAAKIFLWLGIGLIIFLSLLAIIVCPMIKKQSVMEFIILNVIWGLGYGWILPQIFRIKT